MPEEKSEQPIEDIHTLASPVIDLKTSVHTVIIGKGDVTTISAESKQALFSAVENGKQEKVTELLTANPDLAGIKKEGKGIVDIAAENGHPAVVEAIADFHKTRVENAQKEISSIEENIGLKESHFGAERVDSQSDQIHDGNSTLTSATVVGSNPMIKKPEEVKVAEAKVLHSEISVEKLQTARAVHQSIIDSSSLALADANNKMDAAKRNQETIAMAKEEEATRAAAEAKKQVKADPSLAYEIDGNGKTTLHHAVEKGDTKTAQALIAADTGKTTLNVRDNSGKMPIHYAAERGDEIVFNALKAAGAMTSVSITGNDGKAVENTSPEELLKEARTAAEIKAKEEARAAADKAEKEKRARMESQAPHMPDNESDSLLKSSHANDSNVHTSADYFSGKISKLQFHDNTIDSEFDKNGDRQMSHTDNPNQTHIIEHNNGDGSFSYRIEVKPGDPPSKLHRVDGDFGHLVFNAKGEMIGAKLDGADISKLGKEQRQQAEELIAAQNIKSRARSSSIDPADLRKSFDHQAPTTPSVAPSKHDQSTQERTVS